MDPSLYTGNRSYSAWVIDGAIVAGGRGLDGYAEPARRVVLITIRRLWWSAACVRYAACARL